jgi:dihydrofolate reductase
MATLSITTFITLDGVMQAPGGPQEDPSGGFVHGGWSFPYADEDFGRFMNGVFAQADAFLLGRYTYQLFAAYWPNAKQDNEVAIALNKLPKYVASKTLEKADWKGTRIIRDVISGVAQLKSRYDREIQVHGSAGLAQTLIGNDLIDTYNLLVCPVILGTGKKLFGGGAVPKALKLIESKTTSTGVAIHVYRKAGKPTYGSF